MSKFKKVLSVLCCLSVVFTSFLTVHADDYKKYDSSDDKENKDTATYYIIEGEDFNSLFDFTLKDVKNVYDWVWNFRTYTVIKKVDAKDGTYYKAYFNTPNLQHLVKNNVTSMVAQGYTDETYNVDLTEWIVDVGEAGTDPITGEKNPNKINAITRYGFQIPSYEYKGEYPQEIMTVAGIVPTGFWDTVWRAIKSLFGASFIEAPDAENFNTITYLNHGYVDKENYLVEFIQKYYMRYFVARISSSKDDAESTIDGYFRDVDDFLEETVTIEECKSAEEWIETNLEQYKIGRRLEYGYDLWRNKGTENQATYGYNFKLNGFTYSTLEKESAVDKYVGLGKECDKASVELAHSKKGKEYNTTAEGAEMPFESFQDWLRKQEDYINALRAWWYESSYTQKEKAKMLYIIIASNSNNLLYGDLPETFGDGKEAIAFFENYFKDPDDTVVLAGAAFYRPIESIDFWFTVKNVDDNSNKEAKDDYDKDLKAGYDSGNATGKVWKNREICEKWDRAYNAAYTYARDIDNKTVEAAQKDALEAAKKETGLSSKPTPQIETVTYKMNANEYYYKNGDEIIKCDKTDSNVLYSIWTLCITTYDWERGNWIDPAMQTLMDRYEKCVDLTNDYDAFIEKLNLVTKAKDMNPKKPMAGIAYSQCLIAVSKGQEKESCINTDYGEETTITVASLYAYSGLYTFTPFSYKDWKKYEENHKAKNGYWDDKDNAQIYINAETLTEEQAHRIINFIKNSAGPYYSQVMSNIIKLIVQNAAYEKDTAPAEVMHSDDVRVMPYDLSTLAKDDAENYDVTDPRVDIFREKLIGSIIADLDLNMNGFFHFFNFQTTVLGIISKVTELSVWMQQMCNLDQLDKFGLSPTTMWTQSFANFLIIAVFLVFIIKTIKSTVDLCRDGRNTSGKILLGFLILCLELGFLTVFVSNTGKQKIWKTIKNMENSVVNLGEMCTLYSDDKLKYLFGDVDGIEVTYYLPYLDAWSKYNTGYGLFDDQQLIDTKSKLPELEDFKNPQLGDNDIRHWSVLLADSFEYHGKSDSIYNSVPYKNPATKKTEYVNGVTINNNAYRVVDHFLAPRVTLKEKSSGDKMKLTATQNENYNGEFQNCSATDMIVKLILSIFLCFLSLIKLLVFFWQWYMFYTFLFQSVLGKFAERKTWRQILLKTFSPTLALIFIGAYSGIMISIGTSLEGFMGIIILLALIFLTLKIIIWWYELSRGVYFPGTIKWVYALSAFIMDSMGGNMAGSTKEHSDNVRIINEESDAYIDKNYANQSDEFRRIMKRGTIEEQRALLYNEDGTIKDEFRGRKFAYVRGKYVEHYNNMVKRGDYISGEIKDHVEQLSLKYGEEFDKDLKKYRKETYHGATPEDEKNNPNYDDGMDLNDDGTIKDPNKEKQKGQKDEASEKTGENQQNQDATSDQNSKK